MSGAGTSEARTEVLRRIRSAIGAAPQTVDVPRDYAIDGGLSGAALLDRFVERVEDYEATVTRTTADGVAAAVSALLGAGLASGAVTGRRIGVPDGLDASWLPEGATAVTDSTDAPLSVEELDSLAGAVTACAVAVAETGTIVLDGSPGQGRRALTLVPDLHICIVGADQVVATVPQAVRQLDARRPQTWISGPSATSDIELDRVEGVHGPRTLHVVLVE